MKKCVLIRSGLSALFALLVLAGCSDDSVVPLDVKLAAEPVEIDFGSVLVGGVARREVVLRNDSSVDAPVEIVAREPFRAPQRSLVIPASGEVKLTILFAPEGEGRQSDRIEVRAGEARVGIAVEGIGAIAALAAPSRIDFGGVAVGGVERKEFTLTNESLAALQVSVELEGGSADRFSAPVSFMLDSRADVTVPVSYAPLAPTTDEARLVLRGCATCEAYVVSLIGRGTAEAVDVSPRSLDFGPVALGSTVERTVRVSNLSSLDVRVHAADLVAPGAVPFIAELPEPGRVLAANGTIDIPVAYRPESAGSHVSSLRLQVGTTVVQVPLTGEGVDGMLFAVPSSLDLGVTGPGTPLEGTVLISSTALSGLEVAELALEGAAGFSLVDPPTQPIPLTEPVPVVVRFEGAARGASDATLLVRTNRPGIDLRVPLGAMVVHASPCNLDVRPPSVRFGLTRPGDATVRQVALRNTGSTPCDLWDIRIEEDAFASFSLGTSLERAVEITPGEEISLDLRFMPTRERLSPERASLRFEVSPPGSEFQEVLLSGLASDPGIVADPVRLDFGEVAVGARALRGMHLANVGTWHVELTRIALGEAAPFERRDGLPLPGTLAPGSSSTLAIEFAPDAEGAFASEFELWFRDVPEPMLVPVQGTGVDTPCTGSCLAPQVVCPGPRVVAVHTPVDLVGTAVAGGSEQPGCSWQVVQAPTGSMAVPAAATCSTTFRPDAIGRYELQLLVTDAGGGSASCTAEIQAVPMPNFVVETSWSGRDDLDLHLFHPSGRTPTDPAAWFEAPWDCFFSNPAPAWDTAARSDDPMIGRDERQGTGPEIVTIARPSIGTAYILGVHWFDSAHGNAGQQITTRIYCGGVLVQEVQSTLDHAWEAVVIGEVAFDTPTTCAFTPLGNRLVVAP